MTRYITSVDVRDFSCPCEHKNSTVFTVGEATCGVWDPQFERYGHTEDSPAWDHEDDEGVGAPLT